MVWCIGCEAIEYISVSGETNYVFCTSTKPYDLHHKYKWTLRIRFLHIHIIYILLGILVVVVVVFQFVIFLFLRFEFIFYFQLLLMLQMTKSSMVLTYKTILCIMYNEPRDLFLSLSAWFFFIILFYVHTTYMCIYIHMIFCCYASFFIFKVVGCCCCWAVHFCLFFLFLRFAMHLSAMHHCSKKTAKCTLCLGFYVFLHSFGNLSFSHFYVVLFSNILCLCTF